jgi:uncharacterized protein (DUF4415 family)
MSKPLEPSEYGNQDWARASSARIANLNGPPHTLRDGRQVASDPDNRARKVRISVRLSLHVVESFRASGHGWQARVDQALKDWLKTQSPIQQKREMNKR